MIQRMIGAALLRTGTYEEVESDTSATLQAMLVVVVVSLASGVGNVGVGGFMALGFGVLAAVAGWSFWAWITYFVGTKILSTPETHANWGQLARTLGYAQTPGLFKVFGFLPGIWPVIFFLRLSGSWSQRWSLSGKPWTTHLRGGPSRLRSLASSASQ